MTSQPLAISTTDGGASIPRARRYAANEAGSPFDGLRTDRMPRRMSISENLFNKLVLQPSNIARTKPDKDLGNPTPIALTGFLIALSQQSCDLMGLRGTGGNMAAGTACYIFFGGLLQFVGGLLEFTLGHTFPSVVFCSFGAFYLSVGTGLIPALNTWSSYVPESVPTSAGLKSTEYHAAAGFFPLWMAVLCFFYMIIALRTNVCFVVIFFLLTLGLSFDTAAHWRLALDYAGNGDVARRLTTISGAFLFIAALIGWYVFASVMLVSIDFPIQIPIGELSNIIRGRSQRVNENALEMGEDSSKGPSS